MKLSQNEIKQLLERCTLNTSNPGFDQRMQTFYWKVGIYRSPFAQGQEFPDELNPDWLDEGTEASQINVKNYKL